jgi:hypothetical protein
MMLYLSLLLAPLITTGLVFLYAAEREVLVPTDFGVLFMPPVFWFALLLIDFRTKSLANFFSEPLWILWVVCALFVIRTFATKMGSPLQRSLAALCLGCGVALAIYCCVPFLPE